MQEMMNAIVKSERAEGLTWCEVPVPDPGPNDVLIKLRKTAICGTDVHIYNWDNWAQATIPVPMVVGHEFCGEIAAVGSEVTKYVIGQRVSGEGHLVCGLCRNCRAGRGHLCRHSLGVGVHRPGAFGQYMVLPQSNVVAIPDDIPDEIAAILDPFGNAVHTALSFDLVGEDVLVTGAGPIGIMGALVAQRVGARKVVITDVKPHRLELAKSMGVQYVVDATLENLPTVMKKIGMKEAFDVGLEMSGAAKAMQDMIENMNNGGKIAILGIAPAAFEIDWNRVIFKMLHLKGIYGREMYETWYKMMALISGGLDLAGLITHQFQANEFQRGFEAILSGNAGKVVLDWN